MLRRRTKIQGQSIYEYIALITFIIFILISFQKYIVQGISGRWKTIGDSFGQGKVYDPHKTTECAFDFMHTNTWYNVVCFEEHCIDDCLEISGTATDCTDCINFCHTPLCD